jgi:predicted porin
VQAQSNVTIYGLIDMSVNYAQFGSTATKPSQHIYTLTNDSSRLGFRGTEDLGGGMRAFFKLETGVALDTGVAGTTTQFWSRESYVGMGDNRLGSVQLGSMFGPELWSSGKVDPFGRFGLGAILSLLQGSPRGWATSYNNAVQYLTPDIYGLAGRLMVAASEGLATGKMYAGSLEYTEGQLYAVVNYDRVGVTAAAVGLAGSSIPNSTTVSGGATYDFRVLKLAAWLQTNRVNNAPNANSYMVGATVPAGPGEFRGSYAHRSLSNADASLGALGYFYRLSKRTTVFTQVAHVNNSGTAAFGLGPARVEEAPLLAAGRDGNAIQVGVHTLF